MSLEKWKRSSNFPTTYVKFNIDGVEYRIEDIPINRHEEACRFMLKYFVPYEPKLITRNGKDDPVVLEDYFNMFMTGIKQQVSVACFKDNSDDFVGINILEVLGRNDPTFSFTVITSLGMMKMN